MLLIDHLSHTELQEIRTACSYLFSPELAGSDEFLKNLELRSVKNAFRQEAKRYHPDIRGDEPEYMLKRRTERFVKIKESYEILKDYFPEEERPVTGQDTSRRKIIAVGGAKGGIGKSILAANIGVFLSYKGRRTVLVDLDLGAANLHLYIGETYLKHNINDFLSRRSPTLKKIMVKSKYGPYLIGGDSSQLGAANIQFVRKQKLLREIKNIEADYIILDLGGDTSYNIIDFFLGAEHKLVMTTCDPASYLDAYSFIKVSLYRRLNRIFGPESELRGQKDQDLERIINEATMSYSGNKVDRIEELMERIDKEQPWNLSLINKELKDFHPNLIVNMTADSSNVMEVVNRIQEVSQRMLSIKVGYLGSIPYQEEIKSSAMDLVPVTAKYPKGVFSKIIRDMLDNIEH